MRLNPVNVQNVVTYNVVIDVNNPEQKLKPGMTANLTITIDERNNVLKVPNSALRFTPQDANRQRDRSRRRCRQVRGRAQGRRRQQQGDELRRRAMVARTGLHRRQRQCCRVRRASCG